MKVKKIISLIFILLMLLPLVINITVFNAKDNSGYVTITFEDYGKRNSDDAGDFPTALGTIISKTKVKIQSKDTIASVTLRLLKSKGIDYYNTGSPDMGGGFYLESIDNFVTAGGKKVSDGYGLGEFSAGQESGWMVSYNNWFINQSASEFYVENGDVIKWQFTAVGQGKDIGCDWSNPSARITGLSIDKGTLSPEFSTSVKSYILLVENTVKSVALEAQQENYCAKVTYSSKGKSYKCLRQIPVTNGTKIKVLCEFIPKLGGSATLKDSVTITVKYKEDTTKEKQQSEEKTSVVNNRTTGTNVIEENTSEKELSYQAENNVQYAGNDTNEVTVENSSSTSTAATISNTEAATSLNVTESTAAENNNRKVKNEAPQNELNIIYPVVIISSGIILFIIITCVMIIYKKHKERKK